MTTSDETGTFCHDHIEHPLMWCDEKKRLIERKNAEDSLRMWRRRKAEEFARKERDKQEYYDLAVKHCPWGRPGGGAPNVDVRRKDITAVGLHSTPSIINVHRLNSLQPCRYGDYFAQRKKCHDAAVGPPHHHQHHYPLNHYHHHHHQHGGRLSHHAPAAAAAIYHHLGEHVGVGVAPAKNGETVQIAVKEHPSMSFRNKGHVDIEVRYKPPPASRPGKPLLEKIIVTDADKCPLPGGVVHVQSPTKKKLLARSMEKPPCKEPWGKAGPGGKPWRSPKAVGSTFMRSLGWTNKEMLKELDQDNPVTPAEKNTFRKPSHAAKKRCCDVCVCTCPTMAGSPLKPMLKRHPAHGIGGGGGCLKDQPSAVVSKQKICPRLLRRAGTLPKGDADVSTAEHHPPPLPPPPAPPSDLPGGGVELVPLLARRRAANANRPVSLSSTDVTKRTPACNDRLSTAADMHYLHDLNMQMSQKRRSISVTQQLDREQCNNHFETFDSYWGRPGNGAPGEVRTKSKLDDLLYGQPGCTSE